MKWHDYSNWLLNRVDSVPNNQQINFGHWRADQEPQHPGVAWEKRLTSATYPFLADELNDRSVETNRPAEALLDFTSADILCHKQTQFLTLEKAHSPHLSAN